jgi:chromosome segregation ATPase
MIRSHSSNRNLIMYKNNFDDKQKIDDFQRMLDESLRRTNELLVDVRTSESTCEQLKEQNQTIRTEYDQLLSTASDLRTEIDKLQIEKQQMSQLQEEVLNRIKQDIQTKTNNQEENLLNTRLQQSVDELNSIMKDCVKQTELTNGTPAHVANLTNLEILYRQLQQRHQYDLEQHFAITESLKIKAKDAQNDLQKLEHQCEEMRSKFNEEQRKSAAKITELESKLRNADTTTVLTRLLPSATLENRLKEEEERTQQLRNWTNKLTEKIEHIQKQMANDKKEYEEKMEEMRKELRDSRNEYDAAEKRFEIAQEEQQKCLNEFKEKEEAFEMEIFKLKTELDSSQVTNTSLKETIIIKEEDIRLLHDRIIDYETKMINLEKEFFTLKDKYARQTKEHNLPISEPPSPTLNQADLNIDDNSLEAAVESKTPGKRRRIASANERTAMKLRYVRSQSVDCQSTINNDDEAAEDNDDAMSTCSEPPSAKKRKRRGNDATRLPAVDEEIDNDNGTNSQENAAIATTYNLRSRTKRLPKRKKISL